VLDRLIAQLAQRGGRSVLAFVADHGEDIDGPACPGSTLKRESRWSYRVPALVWVSDALAREQPQLLPALRSRAGDPLRTDAVYPTLLALAGVSIPPDGEARSPSLLAAPAPGPRLVVGKDNAWTDFDAAEKRDPCRIAQPLLH
jgi:arylsulfatase A-like enzyme